MEATQAYVNPEDLKKFGAELAAFCDHVAAYQAKLISELNRLGNTFKDDNYREFCDHFHRSELLLKKFIETARQTTPELNKDAKIIEDSQRVRIEL